MSAAVVAYGAAFAIALVVAMSAALAAFTSSNATKRVAALLVALIGAVLAAAALGAPASVLIAGGALAFVYCTVGVALIVRLQEAYGGVEVFEIDAADEQSEPREPEA
jgi:predicted tellurium resistance membrane protein TerC